MKLPWVSRELYEEAFRQHIAILRTESIRYDNLFAEYAKLRMDDAIRMAGPKPQPDPREEGPLKPRKPDELKELIHEKCGSDYRKRSMMLRQLAADRADGVNEATIQDAIEHGYQSEGVTY